MGDGAEVLSRRKLLAASILLGTGTTFLSRRAAGLDEQSGYGPLAPATDLETGLPLLKLPAGFQYRSFGWAGEPMADGSPTPTLHDGMGVVQTLDRRGHSLVLMRNHERGVAARIGSASTPAYDDFKIPPIVPGMGGGTTALVVNRGRLERTVPTLAGTLVNCAGGVTPWGSWLTCEEIQVRGGRVGARDHGFVFEVPSPLLGASTASPIVDMGFMKHEAVAVDARTGYVYLTEDNGPSGFYRFRPRDTSAQLGRARRRRHARDAQGEGRRQSRSRRCGGRRAPRYRVGRHRRAECRSGTARNARRRPAADFRQR